MPEAEKRMTVSKKPKIALCLSGRGLRATFFHLGAIRLLREANLLGNVTHIFSVSGGSITAAHVVLNWERFVGPHEEGVQAEQELFELAKRDIRGRVVRRWLLARLLLIPPQLIGTLGRTNFLEHEYERFFKKANLHSLQGQGRAELKY